MLFLPPDVAGDAGTAFDGEVDRLEGLLKARGLSISTKDFRLCRVEGGAAEADS